MIEHQVVVAVVAAVVLYIVAQRFALRKTLPLPPGPPGYPLIGNLLDLPTAGWDWKTFGAWADRYGPLISARAFGNTIVVINSHATALALLESRGPVYASRPHLVMPVDLMGWKDAMAFTPYGPRLRAYRRTFHAELGSRESVETYHPQEEEHARRFVRKVLESPERLMDHCYHHAGAIVLRVAYGYHADEEHDPIIRAGNEAMATFNKGSSPTAFLVNTISILKHVPEWFPGAGFQRQARLWSSHYRQMVEPPFEMVKATLEKGTAEDNFVAKSLMKATTKAEEENIMHAAGSMFGGGGDTTAIAVHFFFLMMILHSDVQRRAQAEIDAAVGRKHLPSFEDRERLPYVDAICKEILRLHPPVPNGLPHATLEDDVYEGYFIPKGSTVLTNIWKMCRDPKTYADAKAFRPERFLGPAPELDPKQLIFGFGRRICPGRLLADASVFITVATCLAVLDIRPVIQDGKRPVGQDGKRPVGLNGDRPVGQDGERLMPEYKTYGRPVDRLLPFTCDIVPRSGSSVMLESIFTR